MQADPSAHPLIEHIGHDVRGESRKTTQYQKCVPKYDRLMFRYIRKKISEKCFNSSCPDKLVWG